MGNVLTSLMTGKRYAVLIADVSVAGGFEVLPTTSCAL
jgi:hypothetical protein